MTVVKALVLNNFHIYKDFLKGLTTHWTSNYVVQKVLAGFNILGACGFLRMSHIVYANKSVSILDTKSDVIGKIFLFIRRVIFRRENIFSYILLFLWLSVFFFFFKLWNITGKSQAN